MRHLTNDIINGKRSKAKRKKKRWNEKKKR